MKQAAPTGSTGTIWAGAAIAVGLIVILLLGGCEESMCRSKEWMEQTCSLLESRLLTDFPWEGREEKEVVGRCYSGTHVREETMVSEYEERRM